jgi:hypothetical protein
MKTFIASLESPASRLLSQKVLMTPHQLMRSKRKLGFAKRR